MDLFQGHSTVRNDSRFGGRKKIDTIFNHRENLSYLIPMATNQYAERK